LTLLRTPHDFCETSVKAAPLPQSRLSNLTGFEHVFFKILLLPIFHSLDLSRFPQERRSSAGSILNPQEQITCTRLFIFTSLFLCRHLLSSFKVLSFSSAVRFFLFFLIFVFSCCLHHHQHFISLFKTSHFLFFTSLSGMPSVSIFFLSSVLLLLILIFISIQTCQGCPQLGNYLQPPHLYKVNCVDDFSARKFTLISCTMALGPGQNWKRVTECSPPICIEYSLVSLRRTVRIVSIFLNPQ
ncbi:hypothetical protein VP01_5972g1, partial [Puccinia sorghi]